MTELSLLGIVVIIILACIAAYYQLLLYRKKRRRCMYAQKLKMVLTDRRERNIKSIIIIARAILDEQVTLTEASIRINALSQILTFDDSTQDIMIVFKQLSETTAHIPILDRWHALPKTKKIAFDKEREQIETNFHDFIHAAAEKIVKEDLLLTDKIARV